MKDVSTKLDNDIERNWVLFLRLDRNFEAKLNIELQSWAATLKPQLTISLQNDIDMYITRPKPTE